LGFGGKDRFLILLELSKATNQVLFWKNEDVVGGAPLFLNPFDCGGRSFIFEFIHSLIVGALLFFPLPFSKDPSLIILVY